MRGARIVPPDATYFPDGENLATLTGCECSAYTYDLLKSERSRTITFVPFT
jgi:hypothetical protein